jgi:predicted adenylyl cyclase CyaB
MKGEYNPPMPKNIEIKARIHDFAAFQARVEALSNTPVEIIPQEDTFFYTPQGRLKLRQLAPDRAQLVSYQRPDQDGPKRSEYYIFETNQPEALKNVLSFALGVRGVVRKTRFLYLAGQTRIHLDDVEGLGHFMELEVVLREGQSEAEGQAIARDLMTRLGVREEDLLEGAYMDLLEQTRTANTPTPPQPASR